MRTFRNPFAAGRAYPGSVAAIGKFDGLHRGHARVLRAARRRAKTLRSPLIVVTFEPHPVDLFSPGQRVPLTSAGERARLLKAAGVDALVLLPFNRRLACLSPDAFSERFLVRALKVAAVVVGEDFCYGKDRAGNVPGLSEFGVRRGGFTVLSVKLLSEDGEKVSASRIRALLAKKRRAAAERLLGRPLNGSKS